MKEQISIVNTSLEELDEIYRILDATIAYQKAKGYPLYRSRDEALLKKSILDQQHYKLCINGEMACVFNVTLSDPIVWREMEKGDALYLHRVWTKPDFKGRRLFGVVLEWAIELAKKEQRSRIRLDTWDFNPDLENYYKEFGFRVVEHFTMPEEEDLSENCHGNETVLMEFEFERTYLVIERFKQGKVGDLYREFDLKGRKLPSGLSYLDSWIDEENLICYQLMRATSPHLLDRWILKWEDFTDFEIRPVVSSEAFAHKMKTKNQRDIQKLDTCG